MNYMKFSIKEAFKSAFKIFGKNFFVVFFLSFFSVILVGQILRIFTFFYLVSLDYATTKNYSPYVSAIKVLGTLPHQCIKFFLLNLFCFLLVSSFLPAFRGSKIKIRNYFLNFKKVFKALLVTIVLAAVPLGISVTWCFVLGSNSFLNFYVKDVNMLVLVIMFSLYSLRYMLVFFYIDIIVGESVLQSCRNVLKLASGNITKFMFCMLLAFVDLIVSAIFIPLVTRSSIFAFGMSFATITLSALQLPFSILVFMHVYTQLSSSKSNT